MTALPFAPLLGLLHCARGRDVLPRWAFLPLAGLVVGCETDSPACGLAAVAGFALWLSAGWGNGLVAVTGRDTRDPLECPRLYRLCNQLVTPPLNDARARLWGACFMAGRGLWLYPLFVAFACLLSTRALAVGPLAALQGAVYYAAGKLVPERLAVGTSELAFGALFGLLVALIP